MTTATVNLAAVNEAKENFKASLLAQIEPINKQIAELKTQIAALETQKRSVEAILKGLDRKPSEGRVWSAEAKAKLSASLKAAAARKKAAAQGQAATATPAPQTTTPPAPVVDVKSRAANDDTPVATTPAKGKKTGTR